MHNDSYERNEKHVTVRSVKPVFVTPAWPVVTDIPSLCAILLYITRYSYPTRNTLVFHRRTRPELVRHATFTTTTITSHDSNGQPEGHA
jgi:hypothetical protein